MKMEIKMLPVVMDAKKGIEYLIFNGEKNPLTLAFLEKTSEFWQLDVSEVRYLKKELEKYIKWRDD